jgi:hypothetical protein
MPRQHGGSACTPRHRGKVRVMSGTTPAADAASPTSISIQRAFATATTASSAGHARPRPNTRPAREPDRWAHFIVRLTVIQFADQLVTWFFGGGAASGKRQRRRQRRGFSGWRSSHDTDKPVRSKCSATANAFET